MKKIKLMLFSIVLLAIMGGALAFKARFNYEYCTTDPIYIGGVITCPEFIESCIDLVGSTTIVTAGDTPVTFCYTESLGVPCQARTDCNIIGTFTAQHTM